MDTISHDKTTILQDKDMKINLGKWNNIQIRARQWLYLINFFMVASVYFKLYQFELWHLLIPLGFILVILVDQKKVYPEEVDYWWQKGRIPSDLYKKIKEIHERLIDED